MERSGRSLRPTAAGEAYVPYVTHVLGLLEQGARAAREATEAARRTLRVGAVTTAGEFLIAPLLRTFRDAHPELEITLHVGNRENVFALLLTHDLDLAITGRPPEELALHARAFAPNEFVLITAPSDPLVKVQSVGVEELGERPWLLREPGSGTRTMCEEYLAAHALSPRILTLGANGAISSLSSACWPRLASAADCPNGLGMSYTRRWAPNEGRRERSRSLSIRGRRVSYSPLR